MPDKNSNFLCMKGTVRQSRKNFYVDLHHNGQRIRIFSDREGNPLFSERQAERLLEKIRSEIDYNDFDVKNYIQKEIKALRLDNYALAWVNRQRLRLEAGEISHGYFRELKATVKNHLIPHLGTRDIRHINKGHLDDFLVNLQVSAKSKKNILGILRAMFTDAIDREDIAKAPKFPKVEVADPQIKWLGPEEQDLILAQFKDPMRHAFFAFLVHMGIRPGEARGLRWTDIDFNQQTVTIHAAMDLNHYRPTTKEKDVRFLPLPDEAVNILRGLPRSIGGFVFTMKDGTPFKKQRVCKWWRQAATAAGFDIPLYQATKHSLGCRARLNGVPLDVIQDYFGHRSSSSTRRYAKLQIESLKVMHRQPTVSSLEEKRQKAKEIK
jgi:integrase